MFTIEWYDSADPASRRVSLVLELSSPEGQRGTLYSTVREHPSDTWPPATKMGSGYSRKSAERWARTRNLVPA